MGQFLARLRRAFLDGKAGRYRLSLSYLTWIFLCLLSFFIIFGIFSIQSSELFILMILLSLAGPLFFMIKKDQDDAVVLDYLKELSAGIEVENPDLSNIKGTDKEMLEEISNLAKNLRTSMEESLKNERLQTDLITNVSHDLRTPLTSIISYVDLLKSGNLSEEEERKYLDILANKAERLKILMNDLIDVSRASSGALEIEEDALDFSELILQNLAEMSEGWEKKDLKPVIELPEDKAFIMTDGAKLSRIVENLISNAQKYSQEATRVYIKLEKTDKEAVFYIRNTSANPLNISPQEMMERFRRSDVARSSEGSGLGLSIAKNLSSRLKIDLDLQIQADLFTVILRCPLIKKADL